MRFKEPSDDGSPHDMRVKRVEIYITAWYCHLQSAADLKIEQVKNDGLNVNRGISFLFKKKKKKRTSLFE